MKLLRKLRAFFRREKVDAEMTEEMRAHLELQTAANERAGMTADEARFAALREFGGIEQIKERARDQRGWRWLDELLQDLRYGLRLLRRSPGFTAVVVATLALGIGINTIVFSFYGAVVLKPLAIRAPHEVVRLLTLDRARWNDLFSHAEFEDITARTRSLAAVVVTSPQQIMQAFKPGAEAGSPDTMAVRLVSENFFAALGVAPVLGRGFGANDSAACVLSYEAWQRRFGGDPAIIGRVLRVQNVAVAIIGVAPEAFAGTGRPAAVPDLWLPAALQPVLLPTVDWLHDPAARVWQILARRGPGISAEQVAAELDVIGRAWPQPDGKPLRVSTRRATLFDVDMPEFTAVCAVLMTAVAMVLLIACVNIVNLLAARHAARSHELAMRRALGAGRFRLVRQLCTESILLGLLGGAAGLAVSSWACEALRVWLGATVQRLSGGAVSLSLDLTPDWHVFVYTVVVSIATGIAAGIWPALRATSASLESQLKQAGSGGAAVAGRSGRQRNLLLTTQIAACLLLLAGAGLLFRGAMHALTTDPGFDAKHLFLLRIDPATTSPNAAAHLALLREARARLAALPEVDAITWTERAPYLGHSMSPFETDDGRWVKGCVLNRGDAAYFETLHLPLIAGRGFTAQEVETSAPVVVISQSAARQLWPGQDPLGRRIFYPKRRTDGSRDSKIVIGIAKDARLTLLSQVDAVDLFFPHPIAAGGLFLIHTRSAPEAALASTFAALRRLDAALPSQSLLLTMEKGPMEFQRLWAAAPATFASLVGGIALVLSSVGIYGVVSFLVARRTREIGVHLALGAQRGDIIRLVLRQTLQPVIWGAVFGFAGAIGLSVLLTRLVLNPEIPDLTYGAGAFPSVTLAAVLGLLLAFILLAAFIPAHRATKVDPMVALRCD
jgi:predicted permease